MFIVIEVKQSNDPKARRPVVRIVREANEVPLGNIEELKTIFLDAIRNFPKSIVHVPKAELEPKKKKGE